jgi:hypothetical protein
MSFVELPRSGAAREGRFEIALHGGTRIYVPWDFEATALNRLLEVMDGRR